MKGGTKLYKVITTSLISWNIGQDYVGNDVVSKNSKYYLLYIKRKVWLCVDH